MMRRYGTTLQTGGAAHAAQVYNNMLRDLLAGPSAGYINDQNAIKHDPAGGHTTVVGVNKVCALDGVGCAARGTPTRLLLSAVHPLCNPTQDL